MSTKLTLVNEHGRYEIEVSEKEMSMPRLISEVIRPLLMATGYAEQTVGDWLGDPQ